MRKVYTLIATAVIVAGCGFGEVVDDSGLGGAPVSASASASPAENTPASPTPQATASAAPPASALPAASCVPVADAAATLRVTRQVEASYNVTLTPPQSRSFCDGVQVYAAWFTVTFPNDENYTLQDAGTQSARLPGVGDQPANMSGPDQVLCTDSMVIAYVGKEQLDDADFPELVTDEHSWVSAATRVDESTLHGPVVAATFLPYRFSATLDC